MPSATEFQILAKRDYKSASYLERNFPDEAARSSAAFLLQQAVEKTLKALILLHGETPDFTHNIDRLAAQCQTAGVPLPAALDDISDTLTLWAVNARYDPYLNVTEKKYGKAKEVYASLEEQLDLELEAQAPSKEEEVKDPIKELGDRFYGTGPRSSNDPER